MYGVAARPCFLILGCGYTGKRVAKSLARDGYEVVCTNRLAASIPGARCVDFDVTSPSSIAAVSSLVPNGVRVLYSIPAIEPAGELMQIIRSWKPARMVYLSTTGVYGAAEHVDEATLAEAHDPGALLRLRTERMLTEGPWPTLVLRPAAIYGPDRGVHISVVQDDYTRAGRWNRVVSRIHVEDLADHAEAALKSSLTGQFPVADEEACCSLKVADFAAARIGKTIPALSFDRESKGRQVDGTAIRSLLGLSLRYPTYREGVTEALKDLNLR